MHEFLHFAPVFIRENILRITYLEIIDGTLQSGPRLPSGTLL